MRTPAKRPSVALAAPIVSTLHTEKDTIHSGPGPEELTMNAYLMLESLKNAIRETKLNFDQKVRVLRREKYAILRYTKECDEKLNFLQRRIPKEAMKIIELPSERSEWIEFMDEKFEDLAFVVGEVDGNSNGNGNALAEYEITADDSNEMQRDLKIMQIQKSIFELNFIISEVGGKITAFNDEILALRVEKLQLELDVQMRQMYYLTVYQEFTTLKNFESPQLELLGEIDRARTTCDQIASKLSDESALCNELNSVAEKFCDAIRELDQSFHEFYQGQEYAGRFAALYASAENDLSLREAEELPPDILLQAADVTDLRKKKHDFQSKLASATDRMSSSKRKIEQYTEQMKAAAADLKANEYALNVLLADKLKQLDNVEIIVFSRKDQLKVDDETTAEADNLDSYSLVNNGTVLKLNQQINQLSIETGEEEEVQKHFVKQLAQAKSECSALNVKINRLKGEIRDALVKKFGLEIDLDEMEESILTKLLMKQMDQSQSRASDVKCGRSLSNQLEEKEKQYLQLKQLHVEKLNLLTALQEETNIFDEELRFQEQLRAKLMKDDKSYATDDLHRLRMISKQQKEQMAAIDREIFTLKMKSQPLQPGSVDRNSFRTKKFRSSEQGYSFGSVVTLKAGSSSSSASDDGRHSTAEANADSPDYL